MINLGDMATASVATLLGFNLLVNTWTNALTPHEPVTADFFEVHSVTARRVDDTAILTVDRTIKAEIEMGFVVRVMEAEGETFSQYCFAPVAPFLYRPDVILKDIDPDTLGSQVTLDWWTDGQCAALPDGRAMILTTWTPADPTLAPVSIATEVMK